MHSYTTLAVLALAVSTASPALSAPVLESEKQARTVIDERAIAIPGLGSDITSLLKSIGTNAAFGAIPVAIEHFLGGNSTRRALSDEEKRDPGIGSLIGDLLKGFKTNDGIGKVLGNGILGGVASGGAAVGVGELLNNTRREPEPALPIGGILKSLAGTLASFGAADGVKELFGSDDSDNTRREPALPIGGILKSLAGTLASFGAADGIKELFGSDDSDNARREPEPFSFGAIGDIAGVLENLFSSLGGGEGAQRRDDVSDLINALRLVSRQLDELD